MTQKMTPADYVKRVVDFSKKASGMPKPDMQEWENFFDVLERAGEGSYSIVPNVADFMIRVGEILAPHDYVIKTFEIFEALTNPYNEDYAGRLIRVQQKYIHHFIMASVEDDMADMMYKNILFVKEQMDKVIAEIEGGAEGVDEDPESVLSANGFEPIVPKSNNYGEEPNAFKKLNDDLSLAWREKGVNTLSGLKFPTAHGVNSVGEWGHYKEGRVEYVWHPGSPWGPTGFYHEKIPTEDGHYTVEWAELCYIPAVEGSHPVKKLFRVHDIKASKVYTPEFTPPGQTKDTSTKFLVSLIDRNKDAVWRPTIYTTPGWDMDVCTYRLGDTIYGHTHPDSIVLRSYSYTDADLAREREEESARKLKEDEEWDAWVNSVWRKMWGKPVVLGFLAAMSAPLLALRRQSDDSMAGYMFALCAGTQKGKTKGMRIIRNCVGRYAAEKGYGSEKGLENYLPLCRDIPCFVDDYTQAKTHVAKAALENAAYALYLGQTGLYATQEREVAKTKTVQTVLITSGETPLEEMFSKDGASSRAITCSLPVMIRPGKEWDDNDNQELLEATAAAAKYAGVPYRRAIQWLTERGGAEKIKILADPLSEEGARLSAELAKKLDDQKILGAKRERLVSLLTMIILARRMFVEIVEERQLASGVPEDIIKREQNDERLVWSVLLERFIHDLVRSRNEKSREVEDIKDMLENLYTSGLAVTDHKPSRCRYVVNTQRNTWMVYREGNRDVACRDETTGDWYITASYFRKVLKERAQNILGAFPVDVDFTSAQDQRLRRTCPAVLNYVKGVRFTGEFVQKHFGLVGEDEVSKEGTQSGHHTGSATDSGEKPPILK